MHSRVSNFLLKNKTIFEHQFGLKQGKSTNLAILDIVSKNIQSFEDKKIICCVFPDFAKAFDTVNHKIL